MNNNQQNDTKDGFVVYTPDEFKKVLEIAGSFYKEGRIDNPPKLAIIMGGVGSGKTTIRKDKYGNGYVNLDIGDVSTAIKKEFGENNPKFINLATTTFKLILNNIFDEKKNIVIEIIGDNAEVIDKLLDGFKKIGYDIHWVFIYCDPVEAYKRHVKAVKNDPDYLSAFYTQDVVLAYLFEYLELGEYPVRTDEPNSDSFLTK